MATKYEQKRAEKAKEKKSSDVVVGTVVGLTATTIQQAATESVGGGGAGAVAVVIDLVANLGIAAWQFVTQRKETKEKARLTRKQTKVRTGVDDILLEIEETGLILVDEGLEPGTKEFEEALYRVLFKTIGYRGNCNIVAWKPGTKVAPGRPWLFNVTKNGRKLTSAPGLVKVPNLQTYWYTQCKNAKDTWANAYMKKLVSEGRVRELHAFQASLKKGRLIVKVIFGLLLTVMLIMFSMQAMRIK